MTYFWLVKCSSKMGSFKRCAAESALRNPLFRYIFKNEKKVGIQELGPRFTLKLRSLQKGTFDSKFGEYEWVLKVSHSKLGLLSSHFPQLLWLLISSFLRLIIFLNVMSFLEVAEKSIKYFE